MNTRTATPVEIDTRLADLDRQMGSEENALAAANVSLHYALGERTRPGTRNRREWPTTDAQALELVKAKVADPNYHAGRHLGTHTPANALAAHTAATQRIADLEAQAAPLNAEFDRRGGWTRYFLVTDGHYHSSMNCQTCNKNGQRTRFGWNPEMSGMSEADALAELGRRAAVLCSVCFPNAPVEMYSKRADANQCPGGAVVPGTVERWGPARTMYGECPTCHQRGIQVKADDMMRKHKKPAAK